MKRILIVLLAALLLAACQPTPEQEYIVNKGDNVVGDKLSATPVPIEPVEDEVDAKAAESEHEPSDEPPAAAPQGPQTFPARWDEDFTVSDALSIRFAADVIARADGVYPVFRSREAKMDVQTAVSVLDTLLPAPVSVAPNAMTKADYIEQYKDYLARVDEQQAWVDAGKPEMDRDGTVWTPEEIEKQSKWYQDQINAAPETNDAHAVSDYRSISVGGTFVYTLKDGDSAFVELYPQRIAVGLGCKGCPTVWTKRDQEDAVRWDEPGAKDWQDTTLSREDAEKMLDRALESLGITGFAVWQADEGNLQQYDSARSAILGRVATGWFFELKRDFGGYPLPAGYVEPSTNFAYGAGDEFEVSKPISDESIEIFVSEDGVRLFRWRNRKEIVGLENGNVSPESFETIQTRVKNAMAAGLRPQSEGNAHYEVYRMQLVTYTLHVPNSADYYEMPCWVVYYDSGRGEDVENRDNPFWEQQCIVVNALDGSIVNPDNGQ